MKQESLIEKLSGFAEYGQNIIAIFEKLADEKTKSSVGHLLQGLGEKLSDLGDHLAGEEEDEEEEGGDEEPVTPKGKGKPAPKSNAKAAPAPKPGPGNKKR